MKFRRSSPRLALPLEGLKPLIRVVHRQGSFRQPARTIIHGILRQVSGRRSRRVLDDGGAGGVEGTEAVSRVPEVAPWVTTDNATGSAPPNDVYQSQWASKPVDCEVETGPTEGMFWLADGMNGVFHDGAWHWTPHVGGSDVDASDEDEVEMSSLKLGEEIPSKADFVQKWLSTVPGTLPFDEARLR